MRASSPAATLGHKVESVGVLKIAAATIYAFATLGTPAAHAQSTQPSLTIGGVTYTRCASENQTCSFTGSAKVAYGTALKYTVNGPFTNSVSCSNKVVSATDPAPGYPKACWYAAATSTPTATSKAGTSGTTTSGKTTSTTGATSTTNTGTAPKGMTAAAELANAITCSGVTVTAGGTPNGLIAADTPSADKTRMFAQGSAFNVSFVTNAPSADTVNWSVQDYLGNIRGSGSFAVPAGAQTANLSCTSAASGYFAVTATLAQAGGTLPRAGTRPMGISSFGILPNVTGVLPAVTFAHPDQHRFGMQGFNSNAAMLGALGVGQTIDGRQMSALDPVAATWTPGSTYVSGLYRSGQNMRLVRLDGIPGWMSPTGAATSAYAPVASQMGTFQTFMSAVGTDTETIRKTYAPTLQHNYYQVTWEPSFHWQDSAQNFVAMYAAAFKGLHATDPNALVMGPTQGMPQLTTASFSTYPTLAQYIDGVATHGYWGGYNNPKHPPEQYDTDPKASNVALALDHQMQALRATMQAAKPNMKLWSTELGVSYDEGSTYSATFPTGNQLFAQAAVAVRGHLTILGEGAQVSYFFYGPDYPSEVGFGTFFDNDNLQGSYSATNMSPKPEALAFAALTRVIDGTQTLGRLNNLPSMIYGYAFQQLNNGKVVTALWTHNNSQWPINGAYSQTYSTSYPLTVDAAGTSGNVTVLDLMGNATTVPYTNGVANVTLTESPIYVVSSNASVMQAHVTAPVGYTGQ